MKKFNHLIGSILFVSLAACVASCDDEETDPSTISIATSEFATGESDGKITLGVQLNAPTTADRVISLSAAGTATEGEDYTLPETFTIKAGETNGSFAIDVRKDIIFEGDEVIEISFSSAGLTAASSYKVTIGDDDCELEWVGDMGGQDGNFDGIGYVGTADVTITQVGDEYTITGLNVDFMENVWEEQVLTSVPVTFTMDETGAITIPDQYIFTTLYSGNEYEYRISGTGQLNSCDGNVTLDYEMNQDGFEVGDYLHGAGYMTDEIFKAILTPKE